MKKSTIVLGLFMVSLLTSSAYGQTSISGEMVDKPTGFSFTDQAEQGLSTSEANSSNIDAALTSENAKTRFRVQLVVSNDSTAVERMYNDLPTRYAELFAARNLNVEEQVNNGSRKFRVSVYGFDTKREADSWCTSYQQQSGDDCVVYDGEAKKSTHVQSERLAQLTEVIKGNIDAVGGSVDSPITSDDLDALRAPAQVSLHQFQRAWEKADVKSSAVFESPYCPRCVYKMNLRELMISNFELPRGEKIIGFDIGDPTIFVAEVRGNNRLAIMSRAYGTDTNIQVYSESGRVYPVYVRSLDVQSRLLPDLVFRVVDPTITFTEVKQPKTIKEAVKLIDAPETVNASKVLANLKPQNISEEDFLKEIPFDVGKLRFNGFKIWGSADRKLQPSRVFRDDKHIYVQYDDVTRLPGFTAYSVFDDIDERIGTRVSGNTFIIKGLADKITLKSGNSYLCIELAREV